MFEFFSNIFDLFEHEHSDLPESLIEAAIERAVDCTDPRLRIDSSYARELRKPVIHAVEHVINLVDSLPEPAYLSPGELDEHPDLAAIFYSEDRLRKLIASDPNMADFRKTAGPILGPVQVLLGVQTEEKHGFGPGTIDGVSRTEVARVTINFHSHQLVDAAKDRKQASDLVKRRGFDSLLACVLHKLSERQEEREHLEQRRSLLRAKLDILKRHGGFIDQQSASERVDIERRLQEIEDQLHQLGPDEDVLSSNLANIGEMLAEAEKHLWAQAAPMRLDRYYVLHSADSGVAEIPFTAVCSSHGEEALVRQISLAPDWFA